MSLQIECPKCQERNSQKNKLCKKCELNLVKAAHKVYWIDYRIDGRRKRERIGPSKLAAENRLREVQTQKAEERYVDIDRNAKVSLHQLCTWYLTLPEVLCKKSYQRDCQFIAHFLRILNANILIKNLSSGMVESYMKKRLKEPSPTYKKEMIKPSTINKEVSCLKTILNRGVRHQKISSNPLSDVKKLSENNVRMRILTDEEFERLLQECPSYIANPVLMAFYLPMRQAEIRNLTWDKLDLKNGFIRLEVGDTKTSDKRSIRLHPRVWEMLMQQPRAIHTQHVFLKDGMPLGEWMFRRPYKKAVEQAGIKDFTFHDLRHCAINNLRLAGNDYFKIMAMSGHKTTSVFKRYNLVTEEELKEVKWKGITGTMDTYMDTKDAFQK